jgi:hypothetical protein
MALVLCWKNLTDDSDGEKSTGLPKKVGHSGNGAERPIDLKADLMRVGRLFVKVVEREVDIKSEFGSLIETDPGLGELFGL